MVLTIKDKYMYFVYMHFYILYSIITVHRNSGYFWYKLSKINWENQAYVGYISYIKEIQIVYIWNTYRMVLNIWDIGITPTACFKTTGYG